MELYIAEKPKMAQAIAAVLGQEKAEKGYIRCKGGKVVTWCFGHVFEQAAPDHYNERYKKWSAEDLPIVPERWKLLPVASAKDQLKVIKDLLGQAKTVVHAGDPDREGQLLVDEPLMEYGYRGPVKRIWLAALDPKSIAKALSNLKDNAEYAPLRASAQARSRADWLVGLNLTRALTLAARRRGLTGVYSYGRVQTPTGAIVVARDREIEAFVPKDHFRPWIDVAHEKGEFRARWRIREDSPGVSPDGLLIDETQAKALVARAKGQPGGKILSAKYEEKKIPPPLPYSLSSLQKRAGALYKMRAKQVLDLAQALYDKGLTSYPRTDCEYLPEEQFGDAPGILATLAKAGFASAAGADASLKASAWNTGKVTAHHAIIPTGSLPSSLSSDEQRIFDLVAKSYLRLFYPAARHEAQHIVVSCVGEEWTASGKRPLFAGWKVVDGAEDTAADDGDEAEAAAALPAMKDGDPITAKGAGCDAFKTTPPPRFTEGSLIDAMKHVHKYVTDPELKKVLRETAGLGTEATRASILEVLKAREFLVEVKEGRKVYLKSSQSLRALVDALPPGIREPGMTAVWEQALDAVAAGKITLESFLKKQIEVLPRLVEVCLQADFGGIQVANPCPECGAGLTRVRSKKDKKRHFWICGNRDGHKSGESLFLADDAGKPGQPFAARRQ